LYTVLARIERCKNREMQGCRDAEISKSHGRCA